MCAYNYYLTTKCDTKDADNINNLHTINIITFYYYIQLQTI